MPNARAAGTPWWPRTAAPRTRHQGPNLTEPKSNLLARTRRIAGQVGAVERALIADKDCADILHLVAAVRGAVNGLLDEIIVHHLEAHVSRPGLSDAERARGRDDLLAVIRRYPK